MHLARFPRVKLCHAPTPLEFMPRLTAALSAEIAALRAAGDTPKAVSPKAKPAARKGE